MDFAIDSRTALVAGNVDWFCSQSPWNDEIQASRSWAGILAIRVAADEPGGHGFDAGLAYELDTRARPLLNSGQSHEVENRVSGK